MADDGIAAAEIAKQIAALRPRLDGSRGVLAYLEKPPADKRSDVNKTFLASTIRGVTSHNRRQEEDTCWTLRRMEQKLPSSNRRNRSRSRERRKRRRSRSRSRSPSQSRRRERDRSGSRRGSSRRRRSRGRGSIAATDAAKKQEDEDERSFWARKKAEKTRELWKNLHAEGSVSVENAPDFSAEESDDEDVKPPTASDRKDKKHKKHKKKKKSDKKEKRQRSRS